MPTYIATGKDLHADTSLKVTADSDAAALFAAKQQLPIISSLQRIEPDGSLTPVTGLQFDDINTPLTSAHAKYQERAQSQRSSQKIVRGIKVMVLLVIIVAAFEIFTYCTQYHFEPPTAPPTSPTTAR